MIHRPTIVVLDHGSATSQLVTRRLRELGVAFADGRFRWRDLPTTVPWAFRFLANTRLSKVEDISRAEHPALFWLISAMWTGFGVYYIYADLPWRLAGL